ncbi:restriction endonuclease subunit S [Vibrio navarrensis]|uniref:restriction endonuclease subunit S n=1 Tax=Vibrio navarrensis TaxID=29495 RepID=UPI001D0482C9|nr:restriction endonuclease subunit S [Vibrio navarrensis]
MVELDSIAEIVRGVTFSKADGTSTPEDGRLPVIRAGSIQSTLLVNEGQIWVPKEKVKSHQMIKKNDIIMCTSSGSASLVGKCAIASEDWTGSFGAFCAGIRVDDKLCIPSYLYYFLSSPTFRNWSGASDGANIKNIRASELAKFQIPLPPLETQKQIAAILEKADQLRKDCQKMEQELNSLAQSVFIEMFGDPVTNPKGWEVRSLKEFIVALRNGTSPSKDGQFDFKVLTLSAITRGHYNDSFWKLGTFNSEPEKTKKVTKNDFLICRGNGNKKLVGRGVYPTQNRDDLVFPDTVIAATLNLEFLDIRYFNALWSSDLIREHIESGARTTNGTFKINQKVINDAPILFPPLELQKNFGSLIENITVLIEQNQKQLRELDDNFNALMQKAFKGELNL